MCPKKPLLLQVRDWRQLICKFSVLLREAGAYMNHQAGSQSLLLNIKFVDSCMIPTNSWAGTVFQMRLKFWL